MPAQRIDQLTELDAVPAEDDLYLLSSGGTTYKAQQKNLRRAMVGSLPAASSPLAIVGAPASTDTTTDISANAMQYYISEFVNTVTITSVSVNVTVAGSGTLRPAIYRMTPELSVGALLGGNTTGFDVSTTGVKTISSLSWVIPAGMVFLVLHSTVSVTLNAPRTNFVSARLPRLTTDLTSIVRHYSRSGQSWPGSWDDPGLAYTSHSQSSTYGHRNPFMFAWSV
jgi:hypothetical protein